jgi:hypothetical protein
VASCRFKIRHVRGEGDGGKKRMKNKMGKKAEEEN